MWPSKTRWHDAAHDGSFFGLHVSSVSAWELCRPCRKHKNLLRIDAVIHARMFGDQESHIHHLTLALDLHRPLLTSCSR